MYNFTLKAKTFNGDKIIYEIRLKGRQKQGECSAILTMAFFIIVLSALSVNLIPLVYISAVKPMLSGTLKEKSVTLILSATLLILSLITYSCLSLGADRFMLKRAENTVAGAGDIFYYFAPKRIINMCIFYAGFNMFRLLIFILLAVPFLICTYVFYSLCSNGFSALVCSVLGVFSVLLMLLAIGAFRKINDTFFLVRYRFIKGDYLNFRHLLSRSQQDMSGKVAKLRKLRSSFLGWFMLCLLVIPLPYVWCYYRQTKACFASEE